MARPLMGKKGAHILSFLLFATGIALLAYLQMWWPALILALGLPIALKHYLLGEFFDTFLALFVFFGLFITFQFKLKPDILLPAFFAIGGIYIFFRDFFPKKRAAKPNAEEMIGGEEEEEIDEEEEGEEEE